MIEFGDSLGTAPVMKVTRLHQLTLSTVADRFLHQFIVLRTKEEKCMLKWGVRLLAIFAILLAIFMVVQDVSHPLVYFLFMP